MPIDRSRYPPNWKQVSEYIRFLRAGNRCEFCGVENHRIILRSIKDGSKFVYVETDTWVHTWPDGSMIRLSDLPDEYAAQERETKVILTTAHLGVDLPNGTPGDKHDKLDCRPENLAALCQRCHLLYDMDEHVENARRTRLAKKRQQKLADGQLELWGQGDAI